MMCREVADDGFDGAEFEEPTAKEPLWRPINADEHGATWQTLCVLDFRGLEPVGFEPSVSITLSSSFQV